MRYIQSQSVGIFGIVGVVGILGIERMVTNKMQLKAHYLATLIAILACLPVCSATEAPVASRIEKLNVQMSLGQAPTREVIDEISKVLQTDPTNYQAHFLMGSCYQRLGEPDQAAEEFKAAVKYGPSDPRPLVELIRQEAAMGQGDTAIKFARIAQQRFADNPEVNFWLAHLLALKTNKFDESEKLFQKVRSSNQKIYGFELAYAELQLVKKNYKVAIAYARQHVPITDKDVAADLVIGRSYLAMHDYSRAFEPLLKAYYNGFGLSPDVARSLAEVAFWTAHYKEALEPAMVEMMLSSSPAHDDTTMMSIFEKSARHVPREEVENKVRATSVRLDGYSKFYTDGSFHRTMGEVLQRLGMHQLALEELRKALARNMNDVRALFLEGRELELHFGDYQGALNCYLQAKAGNVPVMNINDYINHLQVRLDARKNDAAWQLKDWLKNNNTEKEK